MSKSEHCHFVRHSNCSDLLLFTSRVRHDEADVATAFKDGAKVNHFVLHVPSWLIICAFKFYVCGSRTVAAAVKDRLVEIIKARFGDVDDAGAKQWFERSMQGRYATDIFE